MYKQKRLKTSISEKFTPQGTGRVVAHEMGHNMGMIHDKEPQHVKRGCYDESNKVNIMGGGFDKWSICSKDDFNALYEDVLTGKILLPKAMTIVSLY